MLSNDQSEIAKRPRTPRPRYSPEAQRRTNSRLSALTIDTNRSNDLNVDGSAPSSSSAASCGLVIIFYELFKKKGFAVNA